MNRSKDPSVKSVAKSPENVTVTSAPETETPDADLESTSSKSLAETELEATVSLKVYVIWSSSGPVIAESSVGA